MTKTLDIQGYSVDIEYYFDGDALMLENYTYVEELDQQTQVMIEETIDRWLAKETYRIGYELERDYLEKLKLKGI